MYPQQNHIYQRPMISGAPAFSSNDPGSTKKDVHGRLFLCLEFSEYRGLSVIGRGRGFLSPSREGIPNSIQSHPALFFNTKAVSEVSALRLSDRLLKAVKKRVKTSSSATAMACSFEYAPAA